MAFHETKTCPRCRKAFTCKPGNITQCQCYGIVLAEGEREYMKETYSDCLCAECLKRVGHEMRYRAFKKKLKSILSIFK